MATKKPEETAAKGWFPTSFLVWRVLLGVMAVLALSSVLVLQIYAMQTPGADYLAMLEEKHSVRISQVLYVGGSHHSGTTLMRHMLGVRGDAVEVLPERVPDKKLISQVARGKKPSWLGPGGTDACFRQTQGIAEPGCLVVFKRPTNNAPNIRNVGRLSVNFRGGVKSVLMVRDPRDVAWSLYKRGPQFKDVKKQLKILEANLLHEASLAWWYPESIFLVKYEDLVSETETVLRRLCEALEIPWSDEMLRYNEHQVEYATNENHMKKTKESLTNRTEPPKDTNHEALRTWQINQGILNRVAVWEKEAPKSVKAILREWDFDYENFETT